MYNNEKSSKDYLGGGDGPEDSQTGMGGQIRFVSMIDSKPVQPPYLSLVPFKSFGKSDVASKLLFSSEAVDLDNRGGGVSGNSRASIKWSKLLNEDLEELLK
jgi:hypothetical protein